MLLRYKSISMTTVPESVIIMKVRKPAECLFEERSQPIIEDNSTAMTILKKTEYAFKDVAQWPSSVAIGSVFIVLP